MPVSAATSSPWQVTDAEDDTALIALAEAIATGSAGTLHASGRDSADIRLDWRGGLSGNGYDG